MDLARMFPLALICTLACRPEPSSTATPTSTTAEAPPGVPDDALALVDGAAIPRASFDDAVAKHVSGGPASRDDRGLRQRIASALVTRAATRIELSKLGVASGEQTEQRALPLLAALAQIPTPRGDASKPSWWVVPPLEAEDLGAMVVVAGEIAGAAIPEAEITAEYERQKQRWSSTQPWLRIDVWALEFSDATGIAACDDYVAKYRRCSAKFPAATRPNVLADLQRQASAWREQAEDPQRAIAAGHECEAAISQALQETSSMGCDWNSDAAGDERRDRSTRRDQLRPIAAAVRTRLAAGEDPLAVAAELGGRVELRRMVAADELAKPIAKAARSLKPGGLSKPIDDGRAWTIIRLVDRQPAGTLSIEAVHDDLLEDLRARKLAETFEGLPELLRARHDVELHPDFESLDASPDGAGA